jgi:sialic acid synthase SpsE
MSSSEVLDDIWHVYQTTLKGNSDTITPRHSGYDKDLHTLIEEIETPREWLPELASYCEQKGILFFATPFDVQAVDELDEVSSFFKDRLLRTGGS